MTIFDKLKAEMLAWFSGGSNTQAKQQALFTIHIPLEDGPLEKYQERHYWDPPRELVLGPLSLEKAKNWLEEQGFTGGWNNGLYDIPQTIGSIKITWNDMSPFIVFPNCRNKVRIEPVFGLDHLTIINIRKMYLNTPNVNALRN